MAFCFVNKEQVISSKLSQKPLESKKAIYAIFASVSVLLVFIGSAYLILTHAEVAKDIVELANLVVMFFGATAATLITGQAAMDWKAISALQHIDQSNEIQSNQALPQVECNTTELRRDPKDYLITNDRTF
jgi:protein-S-isoprenylcysteine O-methyltransferase Ste14